MQRLPEIGVLRALGFQRRSILVSFLTESVALALVGAALGVGVSMLTPLFDFSTTNFSTNQDVTFRFQPQAGVSAGCERTWPSVPPGLHTWLCGWKRSVSAELPLPPAISASPPGSSSSAAP